LPVEWSETTLRKAPPVIHEVADATGGVRADQLLLATSSISGVIAYGLWWPWGNGVNISLRVGLAGSNTERDNVKLRTLFRVAD